MRVFLSYSWKDNELVNSIDKDVQAAGIDVVRDIRDLGAWKSIKEYMSSIKDQDYAIVVISSNYLKSKNCMYEVTEILKDQRHADKIFSFVTKDANVYTPLARAAYIQFWEEETNKLEEAIKSLRVENTAELALELRQYKSIESTMGAFLDFISDRNNPQISDAVDQILMAINQHSKSNSSNIEQPKDDKITISIHACHYTFFKYVANRDISGTELERQIGIRTLTDEHPPVESDLPMLCCHVENLSTMPRVVNVPMINGKIKLDAMEDEISAIGFMPSCQRELEPGAIYKYRFYGPVIIGVIRAFLEDKIEDVNVEDDYGFIYHAPSKQINEVKEYFMKYCSDYQRLREQHDKYFI